jgi:hypothetical protein
MPEPLGYQGLWKLGSTGMVTGAIDVLGAMSVNDLAVRIMHNHERLPEIFWDGLRGQDEWSNALNGDKKVVRYVSLFRISLLQYSVCRCLH